ncbi:serine/threonine-protein kinase pim-2-like [Brienomyrus brachyistius]|uniref:serine/threonine-protein kinase pim-2-like n=1 Tax=Brienomyrus brachyistius TaxID=42636 RepID=UPI0020B255D7|nr:serine/threonine-protein kinase pim-2-like [Brienomyrus brachyistius]
MATAVQAKGLRVLHQLEASEKYPWCTVSERLLLLKDFQANRDSSCLSNKVTFSMRAASLEDLYTKGALLGKGGFGTVFAGIRKTDGMPVAIKYIPKEKCTKQLRMPGQEKPLPREVALMVHLSLEPTCPSILKLLEWFDLPSEYMLAMERPEPCMDLQEYFRSQGGFLSEEVARHVLLQLLEALGNCESKGVLHRDVKPSNILINTKTLQVKLIDFGCGDIFKDESYTDFAGH